ncbi:Hypothetical protein PBC10988_28780 [Planctomycetales bacterium 10988]|nr:Hypothetical protein PBC10988_28780 [Planctomycetales bacterium 10988]
MLYQNLKSAAKIGLFLLLALCLLAPAVEAQQKTYQSIQAEPLTRQELSKVFGMYGFADNFDEDLVQRHLHHYVARFTQKEEFSNFQSILDEMKTRILGPAGRKNDGGTAIQTVNKIMLEELLPLLNEEYHPFTRVEAALLIGKLNAKEPPFNAKTPATPEPNSWDILVDLLTSSDRIEGVRVAALAGIDRHISTGTISEEQRNAIAQPLYQMAQPLGENPSDFERWMRHRSLRALGHLCWVGENAQIAKYMIQVLSNKEEALEVRTEAAAALGFMQLQGVETLGTSLSDLALTLGDLAYTAGQETGPDRWNPEDFLLFQESLAHVELALQGYYESLIRPGVEGNFPPNTGLLSAAEGEERTNVQKVIDSLTPLINKVYSTSFVENADVVTLLGNFKADLDAMKAAP